MQKEISNTLVSRRSLKEYIGDIRVTNICFERNTCNERKEKKIIQIE